MVRNAREQHDSLIHRTSNRSTRLRTSIRSTRFRTGKHGKPNAHMRRFAAPNRCLERALPQQLAHRDCVSRQGGRGQDNAAVAKNNVRPPCKCIVTTLTRVVLSISYAYAGREIWHVFALLAFYRLHKISHSLSTLEAKRRPKAAPHHQHTPPSCHRARCGAFPPNPCSTSGW